MTYLEKLKEDHPTLFDPNNHIDICGQFCPYNFGYESRDANICYSKTCEDCWNREIPEKNIYIDPAEKVREFARAVEKAERTKEIEKILSETRSDIHQLIPEKKEYESPSITFEALGKSSAKASESMNNLCKILDSGNRREFETGAVRDIQEGKGRCDLLPLDVVYRYLSDGVLRKVYLFTLFNNCSHLYSALDEFRNVVDLTRCDIILEVSKHFEEGAKKYGENNWQKGIPVRCYIDSAVRHYLKFLRGDKDEPHDRAFCWNIMCAIWTCKHKPELNDYALEEEKK